MQLLLWTGGGPFLTLTVHFTPADGLRARALCDEFDLLWQPREEKDAPDARAKDCPPKAVALPATGRIGFNLLSDTTPRRLTRALNLLGVTTEAMDRFLARALPALLAAHESIKPVAARASVAPSKAESTVTPTDASNAPAATEAPTEAGAAEARAAVEAPKATTAIASAITTTATLATAAYDRGPVHDPMVVTLDGFHAPAAPDMHATATPTLPSAPVRADAAPMSEAADSSAAARLSSDATEEAEEEWLDLDFEEEELDLTLEADEAEEAATASEHEAIAEAPPSRPVEPDSTPAREYACNDEMADAGCLLRTLLLEEEVLREPAALATGRPATLAVGEMIVAPDEEAVPLAELDTEAIDYDIAAPTDLAEVTEPTDAEAIAGTGALGAGRPPSVRGLPTALRALQGESLWAEPPNQENATPVVAPYMLETDLETIASAAPAAPEAAEATVHATNEAIEDAPAPSGEQAVVTEDAPVAGEESEAKADGEPAWRSAGRAALIQSLFARERRIETLRRVARASEGRMAETEARAYLEEFLQRRYRSALFVETFLWRRDWPDSREAAARGPARRDATAVSPSASTALQASA